ncbi:MAG TPA: hypothetical protein VGC67_02200 [Cellulomonas sp.]
MTTTAPAHRGVFRTAAALLLTAGLALGGSTAAQALPPDGPGEDSAGTSSSVWPTTVSPGDTLYFEVSGYPADETVYIKIDDGTMCTDTTHGACVYATQALDSNGYATGSIVVPDTLAEGAHWLRMLATGDVFDSESGEKLGYQGYTRRGGNDFTVVAATTTSGDSAGTAAGTDGSSSGSVSSGSGTTSADGSIEGGSVTLDLGASASPTAAATASTMDDLTTNAAEDADSSAAENVGGAVSAQGSTSSVPVVGIGVLGGAVLLGGGLLAWALVRRRRVLATSDGGDPTPGHEG